MGTRKPLAGLPTSGGDSESKADLSSEPLYAICYGDDRGLSRVIVGAGKVYRAFPEVGSAGEFWITGCETGREAVRFRPATLEDIELITDFDWLERRMDTEAEAEKARQEEIEARNAAERRQIRESLRKSGARVIRIGDWTADE